MDQPPDNPLPSRKIKVNLLASTSHSEQRINLPSSLAHLSSLNALPFFLHALLQTNDSSLQQASTPLSKFLRLTSPNLIQLEQPLPLFTITPLSLPEASSMDISKGFTSTGNQHLPLLNGYLKFLELYVPPQMIEICEGSCYSSKSISIIFVHLLGFFQLLDV